MPLLAMAILACVLAFSAFASADGPVSEDAGDDLDGATAVGVGTWNGSIFRNATQEDLADYYVFPFTPGTVVVADVYLSDTSTTHLDVVYRVYDRDRAEVVSMTFPRPGLPMPFGVLTNDEVDEPVYYFA
ncbi:MAG: hypothetical protein GWN18_19505, partial [Thermoplasmata archaeon]|nr:hypothetical protein [Thermoplasmata archaeon]NIW84692.1 hypothetical protein [Thermoplasmata archaeon]